MCLNSITSTHNFEGSGKGYKVMKEMYSPDGEVSLGSAVLEWMCQDRYKLDRWYESRLVHKDAWNCHEGSYSDSTPYKAGFHIFETLESAKEYIETYGFEAGFEVTPAIYEVEYDQLLYKGFNQEFEHGRTEHSADGVVCVAHKVRFIQKVGNDD